MLSALNLTSHLLFDELGYNLPGTNNNDKLAAAAGVTAVVSVNGSNVKSVNYSQS
jgi:hypothetical protein